MKKIVLSLIAVFSILLTTHAQLSTVVEHTYISDDGGDANCSAYWEYQTSKYVIFHTTGIKTAMFKLVKFDNFYTGTPNFSGNYTEINVVDVPEDIYVSDIKVDGNMAYFCGYIRIAPYTTQGVIGFFDLVSMATTTSVTIEWYLIDNTSQLNKLVAYTDQWMVQHVAAIGEEPDPQIGPNAIRYVLIEIPNISTAPPTSVTKYDFDDYEYESVHEILYTGNYVVLIGYHKDLSIRLYDPTGPALGTIFDYLNTYSAFADTFSSITHSTFDDNNNIILSYQNYHNNTPSSMIRVIELYNMTNTASQQIFLPDKSEPQVLEYFSDNNSLVLMQTFQFPNLTDYNTAFIQLQHSPSTTYYAPVFYRDTELYQTMTRSDFKDKDLLALSADNRWLIRDITMPLPPLTLYCPYADQISVDIPNNLSHTKILHQPLNNPTSMHYHSVIKNCYQPSVTNDCFSY